MAEQLQHEITIGPDPLAAARVQAALIHGDISSGQAEPPGEHVQYKDKPGKDQSLSPGQLNAAGEGNCASIPRAAAPFTDASHVGVVPVPQKDGTTVHHTFLIADAKPGESPIQIGPDGRAMSPIPAARIIDPNVGRGMNGGIPLPPAVYQGAALAPIAPLGVPDLSHVHADPADRAAEGQAHQGLPRLHTPETDAGVHVAVASHLAARVVDPHPTAEARPVAELYPDHPAAAVAERAHPAGWKPTRRMVAQLASGLQSLAAGHNPAPLPGDPAIEPHHQAAAAKLLDHVQTLALAQAPQAPPAQKVIAAEKLAATTERLKTADRSDPEHDAHATIVSEVEAMLPGTTPPHVVEVIARTPNADAPPGPTPFRSDPLAVEEDDLDFFFSFGRDRGGIGFDLPMSAGLSAGLACHEALRAWRVGCPGDGNRCERPARRKLDPRMGGVGDAIELILTGGWSALPGDLDARSPHYVGEWRAHNELVERRRREYGERVNRRPGVEVERREVAPRRELERERPGRVAWDPGHFAGAPGSKHWETGHFDRRMGYAYKPTPGQMAVNRLSHQPPRYTPGPAVYATPGWIGRDRYLIGNRAQRLLRASRAYEIDPIARATLDGGGLVFGISLADIQLATGVPEVVTDLALAGGFGDRDPSCFDPQMGGTGSPTSAAAPSATPSAASPAPAPAPAPASAAPTRPTATAASPAPAARPWEHREERGIERREVDRIAPRVAERRWRDRWNRERTGPIVAGEWIVDRERRHWRDRWGRVRFEPIVVEEYVTEIDAPADEIEVVDVPEVTAAPALEFLRRPEPWYKRWFHWGRPRDYRFGGMGDATDESDDAPSEPRKQAIRCAC